MTRNLISINVVISSNKSCRKPPIRSVTHNHRKRTKSYKISNQFKYHLHIIQFRFILLSFHLHPPPPTSPYRPPKRLCLARLSTPRTSHLFETATLLLLANFHYEQG